ncbi:OTU domain-containing protein 6B [Bulinus truncatus]|nr:OTU domain-containing protein 6B [Bulinus truncatus]
MSGSNMAANELENYKIHTGISQTNIENEDDLISKHRKERKEFQAQIQKMKNSVPKGDKKKKKEVIEKIAIMEAELDAKHEEELAKFKADYSDLKDSVDRDPPDDTENNTNSAAVPNAEKKSKAQKRREKKQVKGKEREERIKEQEEENKLGPRQQEMVKIKAILKERGLTLYEIPADGNCLYNAISHQLSSSNVQSTNEELRHKTSEYMRSHRDDFLPYLTNPDTGDMLTEEEYETYCNKTANSPMWGGQLEIRALSEVLRVPVEVIQADMKPLVIGESMEGNPLSVVYHRHVYRLGEHYNSVQAASLNDEKECNEEDDALK